MTSITPQPGSGYRSGIALNRVRREPAFRAELAQVFVRLHGDQRL
jgi:hypothetical protein